MTTLLTRIFRTSPRCTFCQLGGRSCACEEARRRLPVRNVGLRASPTSFWWAYALVIVAVLALVRAFA